MSEEIKQSPPPLGAWCTQNHDLVRGLDEFRRKFGREPVHIYFTCNMFFFEIWGSDEQVQRA